MYVYIIGPSFASLQRATLIRMQRRHERVRNNILGVCVIFVGAMMRHLWCGRQWFGTNRASAVCIIYSVYFENMVRRPGLPESPCLLLG